MYVKDRLRQNPSELQQKDGRPLLDYALRPTMVTPRRIIDQEQGPVLSIVRLLLEIGADLNAPICICDQRTPWKLFWGPASSSSRESSSRFGAQNHLARFPPTQCLLLL